MLLRSAASAVGLLLLAWMALPAMAQESPTLQKIRKSGEITLGHRTITLPFSYVDNGKPMGYSHELMLRAAAAIKAHLRLPALKINLVPLTVANRIPMIESGAVDLECGSTTHTADREKRVAFSTSFFAISTKLMVRKDSGIRSLDDLSGKSVVTVGTGTSEAYLRRVNDQQGLNLNIIASSADGEAIKVLETGRAQAYMMDDAILYGRVAMAQHPREWTVLPKPYVDEVMGCMMPKGDAALKAVVDGALTAFLKSPQGLAHYKRWFMQRIPGKGYNLQMPPSDAMKALLRTPNDRIPS